MPLLNARAVRFGQNHSRQPSGLFDFGARWEGHPELDRVLGDLLRDGELVVSRMHEAA